MGLAMLAYALAASQAGKTPYDKALANGNFLACANNCAKQLLLCSLGGPTAAVYAMFCSKKRAEAYFLSVSSCTCILGFAAGPEASLIHCVSSSSRLKA